MRRTRRRELRELLERAGNRPVPMRAGVVDDDGEATSEPLTAVSPSRSAGTTTQTTEVVAPLQTERARRSTRRELRLLLEAAAIRPVPAPDPGFLASTEARILGGDAHASVAAPLGPDAGGIDELAPRRARRPRLPAALTGAAAAVAALVLVGALTGVYGGSDDGAGGVALSSVVDTIVVFPDGTAVDAAQGIELPDGTIIRTGPNGHAELAGVRLGPRTKAVVDDGKLRIISRAPDVTETPSDVPSVDGSTPTTPSVDGGAPVPAPGVEPPDTTPPSAPPLPGLPPEPPQLPLPTVLPALDQLQDVLPLG